MFSICIFWSWFCYPVFRFRLSCLCVVCLLSVLSRSPSVKPMCLSHGLSVCSSCFILIVLCLCAVFSFTSPVSSVSAVFPPVGCSLVILLVCILFAFPSVHCRVLPHCSGSVCFSSSQWVSLFCICDCLVGSFAFCFHWLTKKFHQAQGHQIPSNPIIQTKNQIVYISQKGIFIFV